jgi:SAM-dependent methyltransferase
MEPTSDPTRLRHVRATFEELGRTDPLYAVLSNKAKRGNRWDLQAFFETGEGEIAAAMKHLRELGVELRKDRALDFGCGVGRLSQALAQRFEQVVGVDISSTMVERARELDKNGGRCTFLLNAEEDLALLDTGSFDFVYSSITLQHMPPESALRYVAEFLRVLSPGGVALFHVPSGTRHLPGSLGSALQLLYRGPVRRWWKRVRGLPPVEMHFVHSSLIVEAVHGAGGRIADASRFGSAHRDRVGIRYCAVREQDGP